MAIYKLGDDAPTIHESVFLADTATIIGRVTLASRHPDKPAEPIASESLHPA